MEHDCENKSYSALCECASLVRLGKQWQGGSEMERTAVESESISLEPIDANWIWPVPLDPLAGFFYFNFAPNQNVDISLPGNQVYDKAVTTKFDAGCRGHSSRAITRRRAASPSVEGMTKVRSLAESHKL